MASDKIGTGTVSKAESTEFTLGEENRSTYPPPCCPVNVRSVNIATPLTALTTVVPPSDPPVPETTDTVTGAVELVTKLPCKS